MIEKSLKFDDIIVRTEYNYSLLTSNKNDDNKAAVRKLDLGQVRYDIQTNFELLRLLLDEQYSLMAIEAKIADVDYYDNRADRHKEGGKYGYLCPSVVCQNGSLSCRFYKREPAANAAKKFKRTWLNPGKTRKVSYVALQKAAGDTEELRQGMQTEVTFRLIRDACVEVSNMRSKVALLRDIFTKRKGIREVFKMDPRDIERPVIPYNPKL